MDDSARKPIRVAALEAMWVQNAHGYKDGKYVEVPNEWQDIIKCPYCGATGKTYTQELTDYHRGEYRTDTHVCMTCKGSGRLKVRTTLWVEPYVPS